MITWRSGALWLVLVASVVFIFANPHLHGEKGNGRYLLPVLRAIDGELFPDDPMVDGMERFNSLFYDGATHLLRLARVAPEQLETVWGWGYRLSRVALVTALWLLATSLGRSPWVGVWLLAWAAHPKSSFVGGTTLFVPALGHDTVAFLLCLVALALILRGASGWPWWLTALALLVHPLVAGHFLLVVAPPWMWSEHAHGRLRRHFLGWGVVLLSAIFYLLRWAPPTMDAAASRLFLAAEGASGHVSLFDQPSFGWLKMVLTVTLAWYVARQALADVDRRRGLSAAMLWGSAVAVTLSALATVTGSVVLTQLQPLRVFAWVLFLAVLLIAWAAAAAWRDDHPALSALVGWLVFTLLGSLWSLGFVVLVLVGLAGYGQRWLQLALLAAIPAAWALGEQQPFESLRDPAGLLLAAILLVWTLWPRGRAVPRVGLVAVLLAAALGIASWRAYDDATAKDVPTWLAACAWIRQNTAKDAVFLTPPGAPDFRFNAWRTSRGETVSALTWVAPKILQEGQELADQVAAARQDGVWSVERLRAVAASCGARYALVDGAYEPAIEPLFANRDYAVLRLDEAEIRSETP